ncbi:MAG: helix-turn-helix transcriptional regulator [Eggerthellaceae bacterium]
MVAVSVASIVLVRDSKINLAYKLIVPLMAAGLFLLPLLSVGRESLAGAAIMSGYILLETYVWAALSDRAARAKAPAATVFGVGKTGMNIGLAAGTFFGVYFGSSSSTLLVGASLFIVYLFIVLENVPLEGWRSLLIEVPQAEATGRRLKSLTEEEAGRMDLADAFDALMDEKCRIAPSGSIFQRARRRCSGFSRAVGACGLREELKVAYSTVKTHTDHIYAKTGVHAPTWRSSSSRYDAAADCLRSCGSKYSEAL